MLFCVLLLWWLWAARVYRGAVTQFLYAIGYNLFAIL